MKLITFNRVISLTALLFVMGLYGCSAILDIDSLQPPDGTTSQPPDGTTPDMGVDGPTVDSGITSTIIGAAGGTATSANGKATLVIPAGALSSNVTITIGPTATVPTGNLGQAYSIGPSGTTFLKAVTLTIVYDPAKIGSVLQTNLRLGTVVSNAWQMVAQSTVDVTKKSVNGSLLHLSKFGVIPAPVVSDAGADSDAAPPTDAKPDQASDQTVIDQTVPDQTVPDQAVPDQAVPDQGGPDQMVYLDGTIADANPCGTEFPVAGCCMDNQNLKICYKGSPQTINCPTVFGQPYCGWNSTASTYGCGSVNTSAPGNIPPRKCPGVDASVFYDSAPPDQMVSDQVVVLPDQMVPDQVVVLPDQNVPDQVVVLPDQSVPDQVVVLPDQSVPDQFVVLPDQSVPDQFVVLPDQSVPDQVVVLPDQSVPDQVVVLPDQMVPDQAVVLPDQLVPDQAVVLPDQMVPDQTVVVPDLPSAE